MVRLILAGWFALALPALADRVILTTSERAVGLQMQQKVRATTTDTPLAKALDQYARTYGVSIVLDPQLTEKQTDSAVRVRLQGASLEATVNVLASAAG